MDYFDNLDGNGVVRAIRAFAGKTAEGK